MQRIEAASCTFIGMATVSCTGNLERVCATVAGPVAGHEGFAVVRERKDRERPKAEVICHAHERSDHARRWELRRDACRKARRPEGTLLHGEGEDLEVEFVEADAL